MTAPPLSTQSTQDLADLDLDTSHEDASLKLAEHGILLDEAADQAVGEYEAQVRSQMARPPQTVATQPVVGKTPEQQRDEATHRLLRQDLDEREKYARMAADAQRRGKPIPPVSMTLVQQGGDPTHLLGPDGKSLVPEGHVGYWVSYQDLSEDLTYRDTRKHIEAVIRDGGQLVRDASGRPVRSEGVYAMSLPIEASALRLARAAAGNVSAEHIDRERQLAATFQANGFILADEETRYEEGIDPNSALPDTNLSTSLHYV